MIRHIVLNILSRLGIFLVQQTDTSRIYDLLKQLYPLSGDKPLVRLGAKGNGGYLVPDDFQGIEACFSPGVSTFSTFEKECADMGMHVFLADASVEQPVELDELLFSFIQKYVGVTSNEDFITLDDWVSLSLSEHNSDLILQMDIEGYEYEVILGVSDKLMKRFRIIVIEFHSLHQLLNRPFFDLASRVFEKILQSHECVHIHPNNCCGSLNVKSLEIPRVMEFTFLRKDRIDNYAFAKDFPHTLDFDCTNAPSLILPKCWYLSK